MVAGDHARATDLPDATVDIIHRITTDPNRLSRSWLDPILNGIEGGQGLEAACAAVSGRIGAAGGGEAAAIVAYFDGMNRVADATGNQPRRTSDR